VTDPEPIDPPDAGAPGAPETPPVFHALTPEAIDENIRTGSWSSDVQAVMGTLNQELAEIAKLKLAAKLLPAGGIGLHLNKIRDELVQHTARVKILRELWVELQSREPMAGPSKIDVPGNGGLVVP
jgi:hypothetical protein